MKKNILGLSAVLLAISFSAFSVARVNTIYQYNGAQTATDRQVASNYSKVSSISCSGSGNECAVTLSVDYGTTPNFQNVTFNSTTGMPNGGSEFVSNQIKD